MINIIGLGATDENGLTLEAVNYIENNCKNFLRTEKHEAVNYFYKNKIEFESFDYIYEESKSFDEVYENIVEKLLDLSKKEEINYFVPGNPLIAESTVTKIIKKTSEYRIISGISFIEPLLRAVKVDPSKGLLLLDGDDFNPLDINTKCHVIITQIYNYRTAIDLKLALSEIYKDEYEITLVKDAGLKSEKIYKMPLYELDRIKDINHQCALFIPRAENIVSLSDVIRSLREEDAYLGFKAESEDEQIIENFIKSLSEIIALNDESYYYFYEILNEINKKIGENRHFIKNTMEKSQNIRYNYNSLNQYENMDFVNSLKINQEDSIKRTQSVIDKVTAIGFVWEDLEGVFEKFFEELNELKKALRKKDPINISEEIGDVIFTSLNLARFLKVDGQEALNKSLDKFIKRFEIMGSMASKDNLKLKDMKLKDLDDLYNEAKKFLKDKI